MEMFIGIAMLFGPRIRRAALIPAICLHVMIIFAMGLFSFGLIMIALATAACVIGSREISPRENHEATIVHAMAS